jgi:hypothetical protein
MKNMPYFLPHLASGAQIACKFESFLSISALLFETLGATAIARPTD